MATYSSVVAWEIPWIEEPGSQLLSGCKDSDMNEQLRKHASQHQFNF